MAIVKPIHIGRGVIPSYWRVNGASHDHVLKCGEIVMGGYMNRASREDNAEPVFRISVPIKPEDWKDGLTVNELYALALKNETFVDGALENTSSPAKERFPEIEQAEINAASPEYLEAEARAKAEAEKAQKLAGKPRKKKAA